MAVSTRSWTTSKGEVRKAYVVRYRDADGKYRLETFKTRKAAKARDAQIKVDLDKGVHQPDSTAKTIAEIGEFWLGICENEGVEAETLRQYRNHLEYHIRPALAPEKVPDAWKGEFGALKGSKLTGPVCEAFRQRVLKSPARNKRGKIIPGRIISRRTAQHVWSSFQQMLNVAVKHGLPYNPAHTIHIDTKEREKVRIRIGEQIPDRPDVRDIIAASTGKWRVLFSLDSFSGRRTGEIRALGWATVYLERGEIEVVRNAESWIGRIGPCKSGAAYRTIQIPDDVVHLLRWWKLVCPPSPEDLVFPHDDGNVMPRDAIINQLYAIERRLGIVRPNGAKYRNGKPRYPDGKPKYNVHALRHFYASMMIAAGTDLKRLQELVGHASSKTTMDTYGHLFPAGQAEKDRANEAFAAVFQSDSKSAGTPPSSRMSEVASARLSVASPAAAAESPVPGSVATMPRGRPTFGTRSPRAVDQKPAPALPLAPARNTTLTSQSVVLKPRPGDGLSLEMDAEGWAVMIGTHRVGRYRTYAEAKATVQRIVRSDQSTD